MELKFGNPSIGDQMRELDLPSTVGEHLGLDEFIGKPLVLIFSPSEKTTPGEKTLAEFKEAHEQFRSRGVTLAVVSLSPIEALRAVAKELELPFPMLSDSKLKASTLYGALRPPDASSDAPADQTDLPPAEKGQVRLRGSRRTFLIGPGLSIAKIYDEPDVDQHVQEVLRDIDAILLPEPPRRILNQAPVLLIPNAFSPKLCKRLVEVWHEKGNEDSGFMKQVEGKTVGMYDYSHKIRRDHFLQEGPELTQVKKYMTARILPPMRTAFNYEVTRFEDFRIACYDASRGGYFRPHRDNTTAGTAHRRFAVSLLLNDEYEGGSLRFPEYGLNEYRPEAGAALIFSCSLLHEATDVTKGMRFVLLSFFYGEKEAKMREEYNLRTGGDYRA